MARQICDLVIYTPKPPKFSFNQNAASKMSKILTQYLDARKTGIKHAVEILRDGGLVAFPTETVYGLGADARNGKAVAKIFTAKGRPQFNPLIVHVPDLAMAETLAVFNQSAFELAQAFWPGALTLVLPIRDRSGLSELVSAGLNTVGLRVPAHPAAQKLLAEFDGPVAAPSANVSGRISPTLAAHVSTDLTGKIDAILDDGPCNVGVESTIIGFGNGSVVLRAGGISNEAIEKCLGRKLGKKHSKTLTSPGQMDSHYAPDAMMRLNAVDCNEGEVRLGFGPDDNCDLNLSPRGDLTEAAANLFAYLHRLDGKSAGVIAVAPIPFHGLGVAINDRLKRAAAPR